MFGGQHWWVSGERGPQSFASLHFWRARSSPPSHYHQRIAFANGLGIHVQASGDVGAEQASCSRCSAFGPICWYTGAASASSSVTWTGTSATVRILCVRVHHHNVLEAMSLFYLPGDGLCGLSLSAVCPCDGNSYNPANPSAAATSRWRVSNVRKESSFPSGARKRAWAMCHMSAPLR